MPLSKTTNPQPLAAPNELACIAGIAWLTLLVGCAIMSVCDRVCLCVWVRMCVCLRVSRRACVREVTDLTLDAGVGDSI